MTLESTKAPDVPILLRPLTSDVVKDILQRPQFLSDILRCVGSPANLLLPDIASLNLDRFAQALNARRILGRVFFAHKSNQSDSILRRLALAKASVDVASSNELKHALACGFNGSRLEATGPKNDEFLALCLLHCTTINVDSMSELERVCKLRKTINIVGRTHILLRLSGFASGSAPIVKESRFGISYAFAEQALDFVSSNSTDLELLGFSFHLDTIGLDERVQAIEETLNLFDRALDKGLSPRVLNIGGGFKTNYLAHESDWSNFNAQLKLSALAKRAPFTWQNNHFGLSAKDGVLRGNLNTYGFFEPNAGTTFLENLLDSELASRDNQTLSQFLSDNMIELWLEPGRSILDQCGFTLARVIEVKNTSLQNPLVVLEMKRQDLCFLDQEVLVDPVLLSSDGEDCEPDYKPFYLAGNLCLESDLIFRRKIFLPREPKAGDMLAFINTAAYMMDFSASESIMQPRARRVALTAFGGESSAYRFVLDEKYSPFDSI